MADIVTVGKLRFFLQKGINVILIGKHGTGKTSLVREAFEAEGIKYRIYSCATMDPWVDFVGVPRAVPNGNDRGEMVLELARPKEWAHDEVEAIFMDEFNRCLTGDTLIRLADGHSVSIKSLVGKKYFYVYSFDVSTQKIVIAKGHTARLTGRKQKILKITLDNGEIIRCTPDHPFMTRDGIYRDASKLNIGDSMMPYHKIVNIEDAGYEDVYDITVDDYHNFALDCGVFVHNSHKKIRNAVMELIQFKSINDRPFKNLKVVWAAINPDDDEALEYDVEAVDPAQLDRFHVHIEVPYKCSRQFFQQRYGNEIASTAINWWNGLNKDTQNKVSPRRLQYALDLWRVGGHLGDVLPEESNIAKLRNALQTTPIVSQVNEFFRKQLEINKSLETLTASKQTLDADNEKRLNEVETEIASLDVEMAHVCNGAMDFLAEENNYACVVKDIIRKPQMIAFFVPLMPAEKISDLICNETMVRTYWQRRYSDSPRVRRIMEQIVDANTNEPVAREINRVFQRAKMDKVKGLSNRSELNPNRDKPVFGPKTNPNFSSILQAIKVSELGGTYARTSAFCKIRDNIPQELTMADAESTLKVVDKLIYRSYRTTLEKSEWTGLVGVINHCIETLVNGRWDMSLFANRFKHIGKFAVNCDGFYFNVF